MKRGLILAVLALVAMTTISLGARDEEAWKKKTSLDSTYVTFAKNLREYNGYLFLYEKQLKEFYSSVKDSVMLHQGIAASKDEKIGTLETKIQGLEKQLNEVKGELTASMAREENISALGGSFEKGAYATTMTTLLFILLGGIAVIYLLFMRSNKLTTTHSKDLENVREEMENLRKRSVDREMKLNRELQTERNKLEELKSLRR